METKSAATSPRAVNKLTRRVDIVSHIVYSCAWLNIMASNVMLATTARQHRLDIISMSSETLRLMQPFISEENVRFARNGAVSYCKELYDAHANSFNALVELWHKKVESFEPQEILRLISNYKKTLPVLEQAARKTHREYSKRLESLSLTSATKELADETLSASN